jgi:hypothetical protein
MRQATMPIIAFLRKTLSSNSDARFELTATAGIHFSRQNWANDKYKGDDVLG